MDGANQRFMAGKTNWLASHLIIYSVAQTGQPGNNPFNQGPGNVNTPLDTHDFDLRKIGDIINNGAAAKAYELHELNENVGKAGTARNVTGSTRPIRAYF